MKEMRGISHLALDSSCYVVLGLPEAVVFKSLKQLHMAV